MQSATVGQLDIGADPHSSVRALKNVDGFSAEICLGSTENSD